MKKLFTVWFLAISMVSFAQTDTTEVFDYSNFGEAEGVKRFCTQKVLNQTPTRIISLGYEYHGSFDMPNVANFKAMPMTVPINQVSALKAQVNVPVISNNRFIWQLGANYWGSRFQPTNPDMNSFANQLATHTLLTAGLNSTIFKPLNETNFLILQASADVNGIFHTADAINSEAWTVSATAIYGWKKSEKNMIGTGLARTYRAGRLLYIPVLFWNKTFNDKWGMELLLPARGFIRYNFSTASMLQAGFELEGNQFWIKSPVASNQAAFLQRGELKPRIMWDKKLTGFLWLNLQAGIRYNYRFDVMSEYDAKEDTQLIFSSKLGNPFFFNISLNFVSP